MIFACLQGASGSGIKICALQYLPKLYFTILPLIYLFIYLFIMLRQHEHKLFKYKNKHKQQQTQTRTFTNKHRY